MRFWWWIDSIKAFGNEEYKKQDFKMALRKYRKAWRYLDLCWEKDDMDEGACKLKLEILKGALLDTNLPCCDGEDNAKAFFRQGQSHMALNDIDAAVESFKKALDLEPNDGNLLLGWFTFGFSHVRPCNQQRKGFCLRTSS
uniref:Uncharacterized protein n=1 Tax=Salix viminalis TaxID=40686 RepID=A0A6N2M475_SALVM